MNLEKRIIEELVEEVKILREKVKKLEMTEKQRNTSCPSVKAVMDLVVRYDTLIEDTASFELEGQEAEVMNKFALGKALTALENDVVKKLKDELESSIIKESCEKVVEESFEYIAKSFNYAIED